MSSDTYLTNLLGAFATTITSSIEREVDKLGGRSIKAESALVTIRNHPNDSIDVLGRILSLTHSGAVRLLNALEMEKLLERHPSGEDGRSVVIRLTAKGRKRADKVLQARARVTNVTLQSLTATQREALAPILERALQSFTEGKDEARRICRLCDERVCRPQGCPVEVAAGIKEAESST